MDENKKKIQKQSNIALASGFFIIIPLLIFVLALDTEEKEKGFVSKEMYGDKWPLTVDSGTLSCVSAENLNDHLWDYKTYFTTGDKTYIIWSEKAMDDLIKGKKNNHQFMSGNLTMDLNGDGRLDKPISFLEIKAKSLCKEFDEDGNTRYKILPVWQRKDREKQGLPVWVLK